MAWVTFASADLIDHTPRNYGHVQLQYDNTSVGTSRSCRLYFDYTGQGSLSVTLRDVTIAGSNKGNIDVSNSDKQLWSGTLTGGQTISFSWYCNWYSGGYKSYSASGTLPVGGTAPATPTITINTIYDDGASFHVVESDYGSPASATGRYIEAAILTQSTYGGTYRYSKSMNTSSDDIVVSNTIYDGGGLTIVPNTQYYYGAYAYNTALSANTVAGQFITLPAYIDDVVIADDGHNNMTISVQHAAEGSADTVYTEYSYDQTNWVAVQDEFHLTINTATTLYLRRENTTGATPVYSVSIVPVTTVKLYGSVNAQAKEIKKLYGSVGGESVRIRKLYGSVNGRSRLIYEDNS